MKEAIDVNCLSYSVAWSGIRYRTNIKLRLGKKSAHMLQMLILHNLHKIVLDLNQQTTHSFSFCLLCTQTHIAYNCK